MHCVQFRIGDVDWFTTEASEIPPLGEIIEINWKNYKIVGIAHKWKARFSHEEENFLYADVIIEVQEMA